MVSQSVVLNECMLGKQNDVKMALAEGKGGGKRRLPFLSMNEKEAQASKTKLVVASTN